MRSFGLLCLCLLSGCSAWDQRRYRLGQVNGYEAMDKVVRGDNSVSWYDLGFAQGVIRRSNKFLADRHAREQAYQPWGTPEQHANVAAAQDDEDFQRVMREIDGERAVEVRQ